MPILHQEINKPTLAALNDDVLTQFLPPQGVVEENASMGSFRHIMEIISTLFIHSSVLKLKRMSWHIMMGFLFQRWSRQNWGPESFCTITIPVALRFFLFE
jgi:hypothetical protein